MANIGEIMRELGMIKEPLEEKETLETLKRVLTIVRSYEEEEEVGEEDSLRRELRALREEVELLKRESPGKLIRKDFTPEDDLPQDRTYCRKADDAESATPTVTDIITKDPAINKLWWLTGIEIGDIVGGGPNYLSWTFHYRAVKIDPYGNLRLIDGAKTSVKYKGTVLANGGSFPAWYIDDGTEPDPDYS